MTRPLRKVLLATPPYHCGMVESAGVWMPLGLAYLAGALRVAGYDPVIYDAMSLFDEEADIRRRIEEERPDVVATTAYTATTPVAQAMLGWAKEMVPGVVTVLGGVHPTQMAGEVLEDPAVDFVVRGEGEKTFPELLDCLNAGASPRDVLGVSFRAGNGEVMSTADRPLLSDLDQLPVGWDLLDWPIYWYRTKPGSRLAIVSWARGCTEACTFCSQQKHWRQTWRARSVDSILSELRVLRDRFGVDTVEVADEHPTRDAARWETLLREVVKADLGLEFLAETRADDVIRDANILDLYREAGILHLYVGVESVRQERLDGLQKRLRVEDSRAAIRLVNEAGMISETSFLFGFPDDTRESVEEAVELSHSYDPDLAFFLAITPWPYSDLYREVKDQVEVFDYSRYNLINPIIRPRDLTRDELTVILNRAFMSFYRGKMSRLESMDPWKADYLRKVAKLLMEESYLANEVRAAMGHPGAASGAPAASGHPGAASGHPGGAGHPGGHPGGAGYPGAAPGAASVPGQSVSGGRGPVGRRS